MDVNLSGLQKILDDIREKTGADVYLAPKGGDETRFSAVWNGTPVELCLAGRGPAADREAKLVAYLLSEAPATGRGDLVGSVLLGEGGRMQAFRLLAARGIPDAPCFAVEILPDRRPEDAFEHVERCLEGNDFAVTVEEDRIAAVKFLEEGQSSFEFAEFLNRSLYEEAGIRARIGVGCEVPSFGDVALSYAQAVSALHMSAMFRDKGEVHSYREYLLARLLSDVPKESVREALRRFRVSGAEEVYGDEELYGTAEVFLESDLNLSETSRALFIHRNTLSYRLDKIERLTGLDIRKFADAVTFRVITLLLRLLEE